MGKKSPPAPIIPPAAPVADAVDRKELDKSTAEDIQRAKVARVSTKDGKGAPQASLLAERAMWDEKEKSLLK